MATRKTFISWFVWGAPGSVELSTATGDGKRHAIRMRRDRMSGYLYPASKTLICGAPYKARESWSKRSAERCEACMAKLGRAA